MLGCGFCSPSRRCLLPRDAFNGAVLHAYSRRTPRQGDQGAGCCAGMGDADSSDPDPTQFFCSDLLNPAWRIQNTAGPPTRPSWRAGLQSLECGSTCSQPLSWCCSPLGLHSSRRRAGSRRYQRGRVAARRQRRRLLNAHRLPQRQPRQQGMVPPASGCPSLTSSFTHWSSRNGYRAG